jgi:hypothetical protein
METAMKYHLTIDVMTEPDDGSEWSFLAFDWESKYVFDSLEDVVEYLRGLAQGEADDEFKEYVERVSEEGVALERGLGR